MKLRYLRHTLKKGGQSEVFSEEFSKERLVLGRGGKSDLILSCTSVSLEHAALYQQGTELVIEDLNSVGGTFVNQQAIAKLKTLQSGDEIKIGEVSFKLTRQEDLGVLLEECVEKEKESISERSARLAANIDLSKRMPSMARISWLLILLALLLGLLFPFLGKLESLWNSGPISKSHGMIAGDCKACHAQGFTQVQDKECLSCHKLSAHAESLSNLVSDGKAREPRCAQCHMEHNGAHGLVLSDSRQCLVCHSNLGSIDPESKLKDVANFTAHPEFNIPKEDKTQIKLNHKLHLEPDLRGKEGSVTLQCKSCHELSDNFRTLKPINYEKHCSDCHALEFDERLPGKTVPHAEPDVIYNTLYAEYAKYLLDVQEQQASSAGFERFRPGQSNTPEERTEYVKKYVEAETRVAERLLFTRTACFLCHNMEEKANYQVSAFEVEKPEIPERWLAGSTFSHGSHEEMRCQSCHELATESEKTVDVLLPGLNNCRNCHFDPLEASGIRSDCITCHSYHDSLEMPDQSKRDISELIHKLR